ncbi:TMAO reductase system sensor histidine kinase/response regulator TorS [Photobacterium kishitanii]|uniref:TMAO reductase system sensor histidine kinase/response regulator TorS n=1 Tax=Photobacterium kishitanii TaxID=318456 RepID=UPI0004351201|nr:TMAO reductase system sensor histidine kinase/response regulator TorS [Photobacterium kishitanii]CEO38743.1 TMAO reductase sytem sensor TorS, hybrid sensory histidine kinase in two-component regulatory system with TorR. Here torT(opposite)torS. In E coli they are at the same locus of torECAD-torS(opposite)-torT-torR(opposite). In ANT-2200: torR(opposite)-torC2A2D-hyaAhybChydChydD, not at the same locus with torECAD [Photobacterium kishitanii]
MTFTRKGIGAKLLLAFSAMAGLMIIAVMIGVAGFSLVAKTERTVINSAVPALAEARKLSDLSSRIIFNAQVLAKSKLESERMQQGRALTIHIEALNRSLYALEQYSFDQPLMLKLEGDVKRIVDNLALLGLLVGRQIDLQSQLDELTAAMTKATHQIDNLSQSQVANANTIAVANVSRIYDLVAENNKPAVYNALDSLVEVDMDLSERLFELRFLSLQVINMLDDSERIIDIKSLVALKTRFNNAVNIISHRVKSVEDPSRSEQLMKQAAKLERGNLLFGVSEQLIYAKQDVQRLDQQNLVLFQQLNNTVDDIIAAANDNTQRAVKQVDQTLTVARNTLIVISAIGLLALVLIMWRIVYMQVICRINRYSRALLSLTRGDLCIQLDVDGDDELAQMGRAILVARDTANERYRLAQTEAKIRQELQQHKASLERLVAKRTAELERINSRLNEEVYNHYKARDEAEKANRAKSAFLATMSHEIRTPMNGVLGTASLLADTELSMQQKRYLDVINRSGETLLDILNDILDYSKIEAGHLDIRPSDFALKRMVADVFNMLYGRAMAKRIGFDYYIDPAVDAIWVGDESRIRQVLVNLVGNAIKFTDKGKVTISVRPHPDMPDEILFSVQDTGIGIDTTEHAILFSAFQQAEAGRKSIEGTGLGLAISKHIVAAMDGEIGVDSVIGIGSCFWFALPLERGQASLNTDIDQIIVPAAHILLVEDNPVNCMVAEGFLKRLGHTVVIAEDGAQAEACYRKEQFDLALLDINLPDTDGITLLHQLRRIDSTNKQAWQEPTPMVAFSAHVFREEVEIYLNAGFAGFLPKPLVEKQLIDTMNSILKGDKRVVIEKGAGEEKPQLTESEELLPLVKESVLGSDLQVLGSAQVKQLISLFGESASKTLVTLHQAIAANDFPEVAKQAHTLKGAAGTMGLMQLHQLCLVFEKSAQEGSIAGLDVAPLQQVFDASVAALATTFLDN